MGQIQRKVVLGVLDLEYLALQCRQRLGSSAGAKLLCYCRQRARRSGLKALHGLPDASRVAAYAGYSGMR